MKYLLPLAIVLGLSSPAYISAEEPEVEKEKTAESTSGHSPVSSSVSVGSIPDIREDELAIKVQGKKDRNWVAVPIPMSSPTFGSGLIVGGAYFYPQTEEQKKSQPASLTGAAAGYTHNKSWFVGAMQQNYWGGDKWRFTGVAGYADFKLTLVPPEEGSDSGQLDWLVRGGIAEAGISRRIGGKWFVGLAARYLDITQDLDLTEDDTDFNIDESVQSPGASVKLEYDSRDKPTNAYKGQHFDIRAVYSDKSQHDGGSYTGYYTDFFSYHSLTSTVVLAWTASACKKTGDIPLWDTCRLGLRGFPVTEYLSRQSIEAQAEVRWRIWRRWGLVAFAGGGRVKDSLGTHGEDETIPSYGVGIRWMVMESQRINVRVDYARSNNGNSAWYLGVTEAF